MKKEVKKEKKFGISSIFTEKELAQLNFTEEEIADIEAAEAIGEFVDLMPKTEKEMDEFFAKFESMFVTDEAPDVIFNKYAELSNTDPTFQAQIFAMTFLLDQIEEVPEPKTEKISISDIKKKKMFNFQMKEKKKLLNLIKF